MNEHKSLVQEAYTRPERRPLERGEIRHFRVVGTERIEIEDGVKTVEVDPDGECVPCRMDEVVAVFGDQNLE